MLSNKLHTNGKKAQELIGNKLTNFFKDGKVKAEGTSDNELMEGQWKFYRETSQL